MYARANSGCFTNTPHSWAPTEVGLASPFVVGGTGTHGGKLSGGTILPHILLLTTNPELAHFTLQ